MHSIFEEEFKEGLWEQTGGHVLRHPRGFIGYLKNPVYETVTAIDEYNKELNTIDRWLKSFSDVAKFSIRKPEDFQALEQVVVLLKKTWEECSRFLSTTRFFNYSQKEESDSEIIESLQILSSQEKYREVFYTSIGDLISNIERAHFCIGMLQSEELSSAYKLSSHKYSAQKTGTSTNRIFEDQDNYSQDLVKIRLNTVHETPMPFCISFRNPRISFYLNENTLSPWLALRAMVDEKMLSETMKDKKIEYEWYIGVAYVLSSLGAWEQAGKCVKMAMDIKCRYSNSFNFGEEERFLYSKCNRHFAPSVDGLLEAWSIVDRIKAPTKEEQLRIVSERLKILFRLRTELFHKNIDEKTVRNKLDNTPLITRIFQIKEKGKKIAKKINKCSYEKADFYNNLCYHTVEMHEKNIPDAHNIGDLSEVPSLFGDFYSETKEIYGEPESWPDNYLDTYIWVSFFMKKNPDKIQVEESVSDAELCRLSKILESRKFVSDFDQHDFENHCKEIKKHYDNINM